MMKRLKSVLGFMAAVVFVTGCANIPHHKLYEGSLQPNEVAILSNTEFVSRNVHILAIDGEPGTEGSLGFSEKTYNDQVSGKYYIELLPGTHTFNLQYVNVTYRAPHQTVIEHEFEAGHTYVIQSDLIKTDNGLFPNEVKLWIEDITDKVQSK